MFSDAFKERMEEVGNVALLYVLTPKTVMNWDRTREKLSYIQLFSVFQVVS